MLVMLLLHPGPIKETSTQIFTYIIFFFVFRSSCSQSHPSRFFFFFWRTLLYYNTRNKTKTKISRDPVLSYVIYISKFRYILSQNMYMNLCCVCMILCGEMLHVAANIYCKNKSFFILFFFFFCLLLFPVLYIFLLFFCMLVPIFFVVQYIV